MYQGKFDAKSRGQAAPDEAIANIIKARNEEKKAAANKVTRTAPPQSRPAAKSGTAKPNTAKPAASAQAPAGKAPAANKPAAAKAPAAPAAKQPVKQAAPAKAYKKSKTGTLAFYTCYLLFIALFFGGVLLGMNWLNGWLVDFEAAQPTVKSQEVFDDLFKNPDWAFLYEKAGISNTAYEGEEEYVTYMTQKVGSTPLDYVQTSAGLSGDMKYIVRADGEKIATFTLENKAPGKTDIPDWVLGKVELYFARQQGYKIQKLDGHTAYVNGVALDDSFTIQIASTKAEQFLPVGVSGVRTCIQEINGLMAVPTVTIFTQTGEEVPVAYDEASGTFIEQTKEIAMPDEERTLVLEALKARAEYMINASGSRTKVAKYYDGSSTVYKEIQSMGSELWMNADNGHQFIEETVDSYAKYNDELFSAHGMVKMHVICKDNTTKDYIVDQTVFFRLKNGKWVCYEATNEDVNVPVGQVRLTFKNGDEELLTQFYKTNETSIITPVVAVPDGKVFSGWATMNYDATGKQQITIVFTPDETGLVTLNPGTNLEPMTLYAFFENAQ